LADNIAAKVSAKVCSLLQYSVKLMQLFAGIDYFYILQPTAFTGIIHA
jgi:hypothetical protein